MRDFRVGGQRYTYWQIHIETVRKSLSQMDNYLQWMADTETYPLNLDTGEGQVYGAVALRKDLERHSLRLFATEEAFINPKILEQYRPDEGATTFPVHECNPY